jgi:DNA-directed RNA polymerase specialized sigma54-like protein
MHMQQSWIENVTLEANKGIEIIEASQVNLKNITLKTTENNPLIAINNSTAINLDHIQALEAPELYIEVAGEKSRNIHLSKSDTRTAKTVSQFTAGSTDKSLTIKN